MSLLFALFLMVHGGIHIGYACGPVWPFVAADPWLVSLGASADTVHALGSALVLVTFVAYLLAAVSSIRVLRFLRTPFIVVASAASVVVLTLFITPWTLPGLAVDAVLLWTALVGGWHPRTFFRSVADACSRSQETAR